MTNNESLNFHIFENADGNTYSLSTPFPYATMTDADALSIMLPTMTTLAAAVADDAARIALDHFSDDDTDYMPARANALAALISALATTDETPADALRRLIDDPASEFPLDICCLSADTDIALDIDFTD